MNIIKYLILGSLLIVSLIGCGKDNNPKLVPLQQCTIQADGSLECVK